MARIAGINIPTNKRVEISLTYIHGIGRTKATEICTKVGIPRKRRVAELTDQEVVVLAFKRDWKNFIFFLPVAIFLYYSSSNFGLFGQIIGWVGVIVFGLFAVYGIFSFLVGIFVLITSPFSMDAIFLILLPINPIKSYNKSLFYSKQPFFSSFVAVIILI